MVATRLSQQKAKSTDGAEPGDSDANTHEKGVQKMTGQNSRSTQSSNLLGTIAALDAQEQTT
eukprot:7415993-Ditylum_brightwellii.AAC.1